MQSLLSDAEVRVLGCLLEKEMSTPEYYPLSLNALVNACNQKNNRDPVAAYDETTVARALEGLKQKQLVYQSSGARVPKYGHNFTKQSKMVPAEAAVMCELMLRGPQTPGELRSRTERLHKFGALEEVEHALDDLVEMKFIVKLPRQPGRKESRYAHQLMGEIKIEELAPEARVEPAMAAVRAENDRMAELAQEIKELRTQLDELRQAFADFKKQFE
ncbi:MAG TPA: YceH family protein [bacterium]|nr:YceH family protein [bacterium]